MSTLGPSVIRTTSRQLQRAAQIKNASHRLIQSSNLPVIDQYAITGWFYWDTISTGISARDQILIFSAGSSEWQILGINSSDNFVVGDAGGATAFSSIPEKGRWFFAAMKNDGANTTGFWAYENETSFRTAVKAVSQTQQIDNLYLLNTDTSKYAAARTANVSIWNRELQDPEIFKIFKHGHKVIDRGSLLHHYDFDGDAREATTRQEMDTITNINFVGGPTLPRDQNIYIPAPKYQRVVVF